MEFTVKTQTGKYDIEAYVKAIGEDLLVAIWGGQRPHIGAIAIAQPRPSLKDPSLTSSTASVYCLLGHKEDELVKAVSEVLAATLNTSVVVTAGIHWDEITPEGIQSVMENSQILIEMILDRIGKERG